MVQPITDALASMEDATGYSIAPSYKYQLTGQLLLYSFGGIGQRVIRDFVEDTGLTPAFEMKAWRKRTAFSGDLYLNAKVFTYGRVVRDTKAMRSAGLSPSEVRLVGKSLDAYPPLRDFLDACGEHYMPYTTTTLQSVFGRVIHLSDFQAYLRFIVHNKGGFLQSYGIDLGSIKSDLEMAALRSMMYRYPRIEDEGHLLSIGKDAAHNRLINLIKAHTSEKRQSLSQNSDGTYRSLIARTDAADPTTLSDPSMHVGIDGATDSSWEQSFAMTQLKNHPDFSVKQRRFLSILSGDVDMEFSRWLAVRSRDLDVAHAMPFDAFLSYVCSFLVIEEAKAKKFLSQLSRLL